MLDVQPGELGRGGAARIEPDHVALWLVGQTERDLGIAGAGAGSQPVQKGLPHRRLERAVVDRADKIGFVLKQNGVSFNSRN